MGIVRYPSSPLQKILHYKNRPLHEWVACYLMDGMFMDDLFENDLNLATQLFILMTEAHQPYSDAMIMPSDLRYQVVKVFKDKENRNPDGNVV